MKLPWLLSDGVFTTLRLFSLLNTVCLCQVLFSVSVGVTHWKLQDNAIIVPASSAELSAKHHEDYVIPNLQVRDPEFAVLLRHSGTKGSGKTGQGHRYTL